MWIFFGGRFVRCPDTTNIMGVWVSGKSQLPGIVGLVEFYKRMPQIHMHNLVWLCKGKYAQDSLS